MPKSSLVKLVESKLITDKESLQSVGKEMASQPYSEGLIVKVLDAPYEFGGTDSMAKLKTIFEIKVEVIEAIKKENGWTYHCGLKKGDSNFENIADDLVDLGNTFVSKEKIADKGDTANVRIEELIILKEDGKEKLAWGKPEAVGIDKSRGAYSAPQAIDMARRAHVLKEEIEKLKEEEGETRGERAEEFWGEHWQECYPKSGKGKFIYHHHWRGLTEEETKLDEKELLETEHSVHGDLRCQYSEDYAWGFTIFLGATRDVRQAGGDRLANLKQDDKLQGDFKLKIPIEWLKVGKPIAYIGEPETAGATSKKWTKLFAYDYGDYDMGVARLHMREVFLHGKELKGRFIMQYAPVGGSRKWLISKPEDQTPYAEANKLEDIVKELKQKKQKWLIWAKPGTKPELIDIREYEIGRETEKDFPEAGLTENGGGALVPEESITGTCVCPKCDYKVPKGDKPCNEVNCPKCNHAMTSIKKSWDIPIIKAEEQRFVYGIVLQPNIEDGQGDVVNADEIAKASHQFMENCQRIGIQHNVIVPQIKIWESYVAPQDMTIAGQKVIKGSWILGVHILDDEVWESVKKGELAAFSIKGWADTRGE